jgi:hypothetical protein
VVPVTTLDIPAGARVPMGNPAPWLAAAVAADWQCECVTPAGTKSPCGRSHRRGAEVRCPHRAAGVTVPMRLVLVVDEQGAARLLCEQCAPGHARAAARRRAATAAPVDCTQDSLFAV